MRKIFERYLVLIVFVGVWLVGLAIRYGLGAEHWLWDLWGTVDVAFAVSLGLLAFMAYLEFIKAEDEVHIYFEVDGELTDTRLSLLRKDFTRGEILGVLGMIQKDTVSRYSIGYMKKREFLQRLHAIQKGRDKKFVMPMSAEEFEQFEI